MKKRFVLMEQVHGSKVCVVGKTDAGKIIPKCDALITDEKGLTLVIQTADCLPILITDQKTKAIGAIHAGWRGLKLEIVKNTIKLMMKNFGSDPGDLLIGIGPHICLIHYEVKKDVAQYFSEIATRKGKLYLDLSQIAVNQLLMLGVRKENIKVVDDCTYENPNLPSYRRDKTTARLASTIFIR